MNTKINALQNQLKTRDEEILSLREIIRLQEEKIRNFNINKSNFENNIDPSSFQEQSSIKENTNKKEKADILMMFDSNGKYIDRKKLWKLDNSLFSRCGNLYEVNKKIDENEIEGLKYVLINVGVNDLDLKDHQQVFGEMEVIVNKIRRKYPGIKLIISEITPRNDRRDTEVKQCNKLLWDYARSNQDIFIASHENLRDPTWSMFEDEKHVRHIKIRRFAANIITALKRAYDIKDKRDLFIENNRVKRYGYDHHYNPIKMNSNYVTPSERDTHFSRIPN